MALIDKLTAIGNAIREKTGKSALLSLDEMPVEIGTIQGGQIVEVDSHEWEDKYLTANNITEWDVEYTNDRITLVRSYAFAGSGYQIYNLPNITTINIGAFNHVNLPSSATLQLNAPNLTNIWGYVFENSSLKEVILNAPLLNYLNGSTFKESSIEKFSNIYIQNVKNNEFYNCSKLQILDLPNLVSAGYSLCYGCYKLYTVNLPSLTTIGIQGFYNCYKLEEINLPKITNITQQMFYNCNVLKKIDLGVDCKTIDTFSYGSQAPFGYTKALETLILRSNTLIANPSTNTFYYSTLIKNGTGYIYVPAALVEEYKVAANWAPYAAQFRAIEDYPDICGGA